MYQPEHLRLRKLRADALKTARQDKKMEKTTLSEATGITRKTIDRIESARGSWTVDTEIIYMQALGLVAFQPVYGEEEGKTVVIKMVMVPAKQ